MISRIAIAGYRSIRSLVLRLGSLNVVTGPNGSGKSNLYRSLTLLAEAAEGRLIRSLAQEGGFESILWAGPEKISNEMRRGEVPIQGTLRSSPISLRLGIQAEPYSYAVDLGIPPPTTSMFSRDPEMKRECLWRGLRMDAKFLCADRRGPAIRCRAEDGKWQDMDLVLPTQASMLSAFADPYSAPELLLFRETLRSWRFYDTFRTDRDAPARQHAIGTFTPVMSADGSDLAAALQTIREIGDHESLDKTIDDAFPGSRLMIVSGDAGMQVQLEQPGLLRYLGANELSDGTIRYLLLVAALLSPRPPEFLVLNEPENSLHPDVIPALARLIRLAAERSQVIVVSHHRGLVQSLESDDACVSIRLQKQLGETVVEDASTIEQRGWKWPRR